MSSFSRVKRQCAWEASLSPELLEEYLDNASWLEDSDNDSRDIEDIDYNEDHDLD